MDPPPSNFRDEKKFFAMLPFEILNFFGSDYDHGHRYRQKIKKKFIVSNDTVLSPDYRKIPDFYI